MSQPTTYQPRARRPEGGGAWVHQGVAMTNGWHTIQQAGPFSANGATSFQPGATSVESISSLRAASKATVGAANRSALITFWNM